MNDHQKDISELRDRILDDIEDAVEPWGKVQIPLLPLTFEHGGNILNVNEISCTPNSELKIFGITKDNRHHTIEDHELDTINVEDLVNLLSHIEE